MMKLYLVGIFVCLIIIPNRGISQQSSDSGFTLECHPGSIQATFTDEYLNEMRIEVTDGRQLYFKGFPEEDCQAERIESDGSYVLTLYQPYTQCGTKLEHSTENYIYTNEIVYSPNDAIKKGVVKISCNYEDKYTVSSIVGLTPFVRTLTFATARGELSVEMNLYQRKDFHPKSKLGDRPSIIVGVPVYVSVDLLDVFDGNGIVTSLESCYATTNKEFEVMDNYHHLITGRCADPDDGTVRIYANGVSNKARFSFQMFQWKITKEYIYLHCEVYVCNSTQDDCSGNTPLCDGNPIDRRRKRDVVEGTTGHISLGPITMGQMIHSGKATFETSMVDLAIPQDQDLLLKSIFIPISVVILIVLVVLLVFVVRFRGRKNKKVTEKNSTFSSSLHKEKQLPEC